MGYNKINFHDRMLSRPDTYQIEYNGDGTVTILPVLDEDDFLGTPVNAANFDHIENGIVDVNTRVGKLEIRMSRIEAYLDIDSRGVSGAQARFADTLDGQSDPVLVLDTAKTYVTQAVNHTNPTVQVASTVGFSVGREVTVASTAGVEDRKITSIGTGTITFAALSYDHPKGAIIARSSVEREVVSQTMKPGSFSTFSLKITEL